MLAAPFFSQPRIWTGSGTIGFDASPEKISFTVRWEIAPATDGLIEAVQYVYLEGGDSQTNRFKFRITHPASFSVEMHNELSGKSSAIGTHDAGTSLWRYLPGQALEGYELYELEPDGSYRFRAEYGEIPFRTIIEGHIHSS